MKNEKNKERIKCYWETRLPQRWYSKHFKAKEGTIEYYENAAKYRYKTHFPYLVEDCEFDKHKDDKVLEIGIGMGTDLLQYAKNGSVVYGIDLTKNAIKQTKKRFEVYGLKSDLRVGDAENLPFQNNFFDLVYSNGVLHHTPNTQKAIDEVHRVLKFGGKAIILLYAKGWMYYTFFPLYYGILKGDLFKMSWDALVHKHYEMEGNVPLVRVYKKKEIKRLFKRFKIIMLKRRPLITSLGDRLPNKWLVKQLEKVWGGMWMIKVTKEK